MWLNAVALVLLAIFVLIGCLRGALASFVALAALGAGYAAAILLAPALGPMLPRSEGTPELFAVALAGCVLFLVTYVAVSVAGALARRAQRERSGDVLSVRDRFLGGVFGGVRGAFVVLLVSLLVLWLDALRESGGPAFVPEASGSAAARATSAVVEATVGAALSDSGPAGPFVARLVARPSLAVGELQQVLENPHFEALGEDAMFWTYVEAGSFDAALGRSSFRALAQDEALRGELAALGLVDEQAAADEAAFASAAEDVLREVGPRLRGLREDPEFQALVEDPQVVAMLREGDHLALLSHPGFRELVSRVASSPATP
jgi:membrane protein required for colicin V production